MASLKDLPLKNPNILQDIFDANWPKPVNHKKDTREEMKQEVRGKKKKERDDE